MQIVQRVGHERRIYFYTQAVDSFHDFRRRIAFFRHAARFEGQQPLPRRERPAVDREYFSAEFFRRFARRRIRRRSLRGNIKVDQSVAVGNVLGKKFKIFRLRSRGGLRKRSRIFHEVENILRRKFAVFITFFPENDREAKYADLVLFDLFFA